MTRQFNPVIDHAEFHKLAHDLEPIKSEFKQLLDDYKYLNDRLMNAENPITNGEIDWLTIRGTQINQILSYVYTQVIDIKGEDEVFNILKNIDQNKCIQDFYDQIHDRRELKIENDPVLQDLYEKVRQEKINAGRS